MFVEVAEAFNEPRGQYHNLSICTVVSEACRETYLRVKLFSVAGAIAIHGTVPLL